jgi:transcriptional regulator with XRE-family HTH domain
MGTKNIGQKLRDLRAIRGMSQEYLAEESRVSLRTIQRIENNESDPTGETIKRIANALDVRLSELTGADLVVETSDLKATIIHLKKQLSKTNKNSEIRTFKAFIGLLEKLKDKDLTNEQKEGIENYIKYMELEKIPSFSNEMYKQKLSKFKKYLKNKLRLVPNNYYTTWVSSFGFSFIIGFMVQQKVDGQTKMIAVAAGLVLIAIGVLVDLRIKKQERTY